MDERTARAYLDVGLHEINKKRPQWDRREKYRKGEQDPPYAPQGVNAEYRALQDQSIANVLDIAMSAPVQRLRAEGFRTGRDQAADITAWNDVWQPNKLDMRQRDGAGGMVTPPWKPWKKKPASSSY